MGRPVVLFPSLAASGLWAARLLTRLGCEVMFINPLGELRNEEAVEKLRAEGLKWQKAGEVQGIDIIYTYATERELTCNVIDRFFPPRVLSELAKLMRPPANDPECLRILLFEIIRGYLMPHFKPVTVAKALREQGRRVWLWQKDSFVLSLAHTGFANLYPSRSMSALKSFAPLMSRLRRRRPQKAAAAPLPQDAATGSGTSTAEVLFFAHQGPYYGDLFAKEQYYDADTKSPLHRTQVCHVELADEMTPELRAHVKSQYAKADLNFHWLSPRSPFRVEPRALLKLAFRLGPVAAVLGSMVQQRLIGAAEQLKAFPAARLALLGYDSLFPRFMVAAMQSRGIVVAAAQERYSQPFHPDAHLILDHYLVDGPKVAAAIRANPLCKVATISVTGDLRLPKRRSGRREGPHRCLVLDFHSMPTAFEDALAVSNSWASNKVFYEDILRLSEDFPDVHFTIRGKNICWCSLPYFADTVRAIAARPNLTVDRDRSLDRSYALLEDSDSAVARYTSIGDQALALGVPVLFHERTATGDKLIARALDFEPYPVLTRSYEDLRTRYGIIQRNGHYLGADQLAKLQREYYAQPSEVEPKVQAARVLKSILANSPESRRTPLVETAA